MTYVKKGMRNSMNIYLSGISSCINQQISRSTRKQRKGLASLAFSAADDLGKFVL